MSEERSYPRFWLPNWVVYRYIVSKMGHNDVFHNFFLPWDLTVRVFASEKKTSFKLLVTRLG